ncbi:hypothetical protein [Streptomyces roseoverticillatus]|uniref:hypothetical protein n=1 Tax=Streptomyces roseoverticillatus TaxID=66429 RepID=UPI0004C0908F|nr:hypothetical protein [Streptomyces roseoverticillatus]
MPQQVKSSSGERSAGERIGRAARGARTRLWSTRRRRLTTIGTSAALLAAAVTGVLVFWDSDPGADPGAKGARKLVMAYIDALADDDMREACRLMHPKVVSSMAEAEGGCPGAMRAQIGDRLSSKEQRRVGDIDVHAARVEGGGKVARVEVSSGPKGARKSTVTVERTDGHWRILED